MPAPPSSRRDFYCRGGVHSIPERECSVQRTAAPGRRGRSQFVDLPADYVVEAEFCMNHRGRKSEAEREVESLAGAPERPDPNMASPTRKPRKPRAKRA